jgi:superfamily II DNA or RNA helicase
MIKPKILVRYFREACTEILARGTIDANPALQYELRLGQAQSFIALAAHLDRPDLSAEDKLTGLFTVTTGVGKTGIFGALLDRVRQKAVADGRKFRALVVAPKVTLLNQAYDSFEKFFPALHGQVGIYGGFWPDRKVPRRETDKDITIMSFPGWVNLTESGERGYQNTDVIITDEGHRGTSLRREKTLLAHYNGIGKYAFQATPHYSANKTVVNTHKHEIFSKRLPASVHDGESASYIRAQHHVLRVVPKKGQPFNEKLAKQQAFICWQAKKSPR